MATAPEEPRTKLVQSLCRSCSQWPPLKLAALVGLGLIPFVTMPQLSHYLAADAAGTTSNSTAQTWFPAEYRSCGIVPPANPTKHACRLKYSPETIAIFSPSPHPW